METFILGILKKIETLQPGVITYAEKTEHWIEISVSNLNLYTNNERFLTLRNAWHKAGKAKGFNIIFVCGWIPSEEKLVKLSESGNLILNI